jgi:hypothetical protein
MLKSSADSAGTISSNIYFCCKNLSMESIGFGPPASLSPEGREVREEAEKSGLRVSAPETPT